MPSLELISDFLRDKLSLKVEYYYFSLFVFHTRNITIDYIINNVFSHLKPGNASLLLYHFIKTPSTLLTPPQILGHAVIIRRTILNALFIKDIQQGTEQNITQFFNDNRIVNIYLFYTSQDDSRMNIDIDLDKFVSPNKMEFGGKRIKSKQNKTKKSKIVKKNKSKKNVYKY
jgi:hypothetical protein